MWGADLQKDSLAIEEADCPNMQPLWRSTLHVALGDRAIWHTAAGMEISDERRPAGADTLEPKSTRLPCVCR